MSAQPKRRRTATRSRSAMCPPARYSVWRPQSGWTNTRQPRWQWWTPLFSPGRRRSGQRLTGKYPALATNALRTVGGRLQDAHNRVIELTSEEVERRIARTLLRLADQAGRNVEQGIEIEIPLRRQDVGQLTGTTLHSVSRVLSAWEQKGLVLTDHQRIVLRNSSALAAIAEGSDPDSASARTGQ